MKTLNYLLGLLSLPMIGLLILLGIVIGAVQEHLGRRERKRDLQRWRIEVRGRR